MTLRRSLVVLIVVLFTHSTAAADPPSIISASIDPNQRELINVTFGTPVDAGDVLRSSWWTVELSSKTNVKDPAIQRVGIVTCSITIYRWMVNRCPNGESVVQVALQIAAASADDVTRVDVRYSGPLGPARFGAAVTKITGSSGFVGAKADDSDIKFTGSYVKTEGTEATYDVDAYAGAMWAAVRTPRVEAGAAKSATPVAARYLGRIGFYGAVKTSKSKTLVADSFIAYGVYQRELGTGGFKGPFQTPRLNVRVPGWEFDREGEQRNFIVSPVVTVPVRLWKPGPLGVFEPGLSIPVMTLQAGVEFVKPLETALGDKDWRQRRLLGATFSTGYAPETPWLDGIELTASYLVRQLSDEEVFKDPRNAPIDPDTGKPGDAIFELGSQDRPLASLEFTYRPIKWVGVSFKYEYGSEPPVFELQQHKYTVGLKFSLRQSSYGRYSILKP